ncbi:Protein trichome birefringence-like 34 [Glycine soja]
MAKAHQIVLGSNWGIRNIFQSIVAILTSILVVTAIYLTQEGEQWSNERNKFHSLSKCNLFSGKWIFDNESYPLYKEQQCTFMSDQLACEKFGRKDLSYQNWRWKPHQCDLPRFNATALLERLRNKRMDGVCGGFTQQRPMGFNVESSVPPTLKSIRTVANGSLNIFKAEENNATIEFYWAPLLVESNSDDPLNHRVAERTVRVQAIEKHARWGSFGDPNGVNKRVGMVRVYEMALRTWFDWLEVHINRNKTKLFFVSMSPTHQKAHEWGGVKGDNCYKETDQITEEGYWGNGSIPSMMRVVENVIEDLNGRGLNVQLLNITQLSEYRKEGHPSIYRKQWEPLTEEQLSNPKTNADCIHWCLTGAPDAWNELLYAYISIDD